ncbi:MAG TPA: MFS transporter [Terriglobales bacterium]|nr:MFS transporter [Terriglobales bacterium]
MLAKTSSSVRWLLVFLLFLLSAVAFLDRVNISVAGGSLAAAYQLTNVQLGWVFSAFLIGYALFQTPGGRLADRAGPRRVLAGGVIWWGIFTALTVSVPSNIAHALLLLISVRFLLGAGEAVMYPAANQFVARWIPEKERGIANGWIFAGVGAGAGLSPPLITWLMLRYGWRSSFWVCAVIGVIAGSVWFLMARDDPESHPRVSPSELALIQQGRTAVRPKTENPQLIAWSTILKSRDVWAVTLSYFSFGYVAWIFFSWFYLYLAQARHLALKTSAFYSMLPFIAMAVGCLIGGHISDLLSRKYNPRVGRCYFAAVGIALSGAFLMFGAEAQDARLASIVLSGGAGALYLAQSSFWSVTASLAESSSGSVSGFMNMGAQIGGAVTASLTPVIANHFGWTASFLTAASLCAVGAIAWIIVDPDRKLEGVPQATSAQTS